MEASEQQAEAPVEQTESPAEGTEGEAPDLSEQIASLKESVEALKPKEEAPPEGDYMDQLLGDFGEEEGEGEAQPDQEQQAQPGEEGYVDPQVAGMIEHLDQRNQERFEMAQAEQEFNRRNEQMNQLVEKIPDLKKPEYMQPIQRQLNALAERNNNDWIRSDPEIVETLFYAMKAKETAEKQKASDEGSQGATLETGAGPSQQGGDIDKDIVDAIVGAGGSKSVFT